MTLFKGQVLSQKNNSFLLSGSSTALPSIGPNARLIHGSVAYTSGSAGKIIEAKNYACLMQ